MKTSTAIICSCIISISIFLSTIIYLNYNTYQITSTLNNEGVISGFKLNKRTGEISIIRQFATNKPVITEINK